MKRAAYPLALLVSFVVVAVVSAIRPTSYFNWVSETFPALIAVPIFVLTWRRFPMTPVFYTLAFVFAVVLCAGGHYTYAAVPMGEWMKGWFGFERNHFDRLGHFLQGVVPALLLRELLVRRTPLRPGRAMFWLVVGCCLGISASYELFEWRYAVAFGGQAATDFLGSQGDPWDAQQDMFMALCGSIAAQVLLGRVQLRQIAALPSEGVNEESRRAGGR